MRLQQTSEAVPVKGTYRVDDNLHIQQGHVAEKLSVKKLGSRQAV